MLPKKLGIFVLVGSNYSTMLPYNRGKGETAMKDHIITEGAKCGAKFTGYGSARGITLTHWNSYSKHPITITVALASLLGWMAALIVEKATRVREWF